MRLRVKPAIPNRRWCCGLLRSARNDEKECLTMNNECVLCRLIFISFWYKAFQGL
jgi:hypothetical protein